MKKPHLSVYLDPEVMTQLIELANRRSQSKSLVAEAAIASFLTPDDADQREAAFVRRLDFLTRKSSGWSAISRSRSRLSHSSSAFG